jgi:hypothetical protein
MFSSRLSGRDENIKRQAFHSRFYCFAKSNLFQKIAFCKAIKSSDAILHAK